MECCNLVLPNFKPSLTTTSLIDEGRSSNTRYCFSSPLISNHHVLHPHTHQHRHVRFLGSHVPHCQKMHVPGFGEASPEAKAAKNLQDFFTYVAVKIVLAQLESYNPEAYAELMEFVERNSLRNGDEFCGKLMRESPAHKGLAMRIMEVRSAYSKRDFEWDNMQKLAFKMVDKSNTRLMRDYILETSGIENNDKS